MTFETGLLVAAAILAVATLLVILRIVSGPTILDRAVASDMLAVMLVMGVGLYVARERTALGVPAMLAMTALAFIATVAVARFVGREDTTRPQGDHELMGQRARPSPEGLEAVAEDATEVDAAAGEEQDRQERRAREREDREEEAREDAEQERRPSAEDPESPLAAPADPEDEHEDEGEGRR